MSLNASIKLRKVSYLQLLLSSFKNKVHMVDMYDFNKMIKIFKTYDIKKLMWPYVHDLYLHSFVCAACV